MSFLPPESARVVVAVDFGTTFSGFAYARKSEPDKVFTFYEWPCSDKAGAKPYCKTQSSLFYVPSGSGKFKLSDWGWSALVRFSQAARSAARSQAQSSCNRRLCKSEESSSSSSKSDVVDVLVHSQWMAEKVGYFATKFKLYLAGNDHEKICESPDDQLPGGLSVERLLVDYLRCLSEFIIMELQFKYGKHFGKEDVQWCLTVPAMWDERAKQVMKVCAEKAGMVIGSQCPTADASPHDLDIILEPEAASVYCQKKARALNLTKGDRILVADVGGGTIDLVVHEKADDDPESLRVQEVVASYGELGGGTFVDSHFFHFMSEKLGCFKEFCRDNTSLVLTNILGWWHGIKMGFDGHGYSADLCLPRKLSEAWAKHDAMLGNRPPDDYDEVRLEDSDIMAIFDTEVEKVLNLIEKQIEGVRVLMVVGGFSASPYLRKCIKQRFSRRVDEIIIPEDPGSAICHGAVQLHMANDIIQSRIAKRTFGVAWRKGARPGDPSHLLVVNDDGETMCSERFCVFVRAGERIPMNKSVTRMCCPSVYRQRELAIELYSSPKTHPEFTTEQDESRKEGSFDIDISEGIELEKARSVEVTMCFGASVIRVTAQPANFGTKQLEQGLSVTFR